jgi:hypothetical protein
MIGLYAEGDEPVPGFRLLSHLGGGEFSEVWKATAPGGAAAALKIVALSSQHALKELKSLRWLRRIRHPHLVPLMAFWLKDAAGQLLDESQLDDLAALEPVPAQLIIAMGLGDRSLADLLREYQADGQAGIPADLLLRFLEDAACGIDYLNQPIDQLEEGPLALSHCDIKPANILIVGGAAQVCDFGVIRLVGDPRSTAPVGSAAYMAPEIIKDGRPSATTDQYALAISYYELRTGKLPFDAPSSAGAYFAHLQGKLDFRLVPKAERAVLARATARKPEDRFASCTQMIEALNQAPSRSSAPSSPAVAVPTAERILGAKRRWRVAGPLILLAALGLGSVGAWLTRSPGAVAANSAPDLSVPVEPLPTAREPVGARPSSREKSSNKAIPQSDGPFALATSSRRFASLREALAAAQDGETLTIHSNGPFTMAPLDIQGKTLTIKAAPACRPILQRAAVSASDWWQPLLATDRDLTLQGLELRDGTAGAESGGYLIECRQAALRVLDCRLLAPRSAAAVVGRHTRLIEIQSCILLAHGLAICMVAGDGPASGLRLTGNSITVEGAAAAALSVFGSAEMQDHAPVKIRLDNNVVSAGRLASFQSLTGGLQMEASRNEFRFREALLSFVSLSRPNSWRSTTSWRGVDNRYVGAADWLQIDGKPAGIHRLSEWQNFWANP